MEIFQYNKQKKMIYHISKVDIKQKAKEIIVEKQYRYFYPFRVKSNGGVSKVNDYNSKIK